MELKIVMVEGPHDGAFISKVMHVNGYMTCKKRINDYEPKFLSNYLKQQYNKAPVGDLNLQSVRQGILFPSYSIMKEDELLLIFHMGGDSRKDNRKKLVSDIYTIIHSAIAANLVGDTRISFIYEFDADNDGIEARLEQVNAEIKDIEPNFPSINENAIFVKYKNVRWGAYIFAVDGKGKLEDIILPMMEKENEDISSEVKAIVDKRDTFALFESGKVKSTNHPQKACVGMMGQLEKAGSANPAIIEQSSYINDDKILESDICKEIFDFLSK